METHLIYTTEDRLYISCSKTFIFVYIQSSDILYRY